MSHSVSSVASSSINNNTAIAVSSENTKSPLLLAVEAGDIEAVKRALEKGESVDPAAFEEALIQGSYAIVELFLQKDSKLASIQIQGLDKWSLPLHVVCEKGDVSLVRLLLKYGARTNDPDEEGSMPLLRAVENGGAREEPIELVRVLLESGASLSSELFPRFNPLSDACKNGYAKVVTLLLKHGGSVFLNIEDGSENGAPLYKACESEHIEVVRLLLKEKGIFVDMPNSSNGQTPLHEAAHSGEAQIVELLLEAGANINAKDKHKATPLKLALTGARWEAIELLLAHKMIKYDPTESLSIMIAPSGRSPLLSLKQLSLARKFLEEGADPHTLGQDLITGGKYPLLYHVCAFTTKEDPDLVKLFLEFGATNSIGEKGKTACEAAFCKGYLSIVDLFFEKELVTEDVKHKLLCLAYELGDQKLIDYAVAHGAKIEKMGTEEFPLIYWACKFGMESLFKQLLEEIKDLDLKKRYGLNRETLLHAAASGGKEHHAILEELLERGAPPLAWTPEDGKLPVEFTKNQFTFRPFVVYQAKLIEKMCKKAYGEFSKEELKECLDCLIHQSALMFHSLVIKLDVFSDTLDYLTLLHAPALQSGLASYSKQLSQKMVELQALERKVKQGSEPAEVFVNALEKGEEDRKWALELSGRFKRTLPLYGVYNASRQNVPVTPLYQAIAGRMSETLSRFKEYLEYSEKKLKEVKEGALAKAEKRTLAEMDIFEALPLLDIAVRRQELKSDNNNSRNQYSKDYIQVTPQQDLSNKLGCTPEELYAMGLTSGADLDKIGVTSRLRSLTIQLEEKFIGQDPLGFSLLCQVVDEIDANVEMGKFFKLDGSYLQKDAESIKDQVLGLLNLKQERDSLLKGHADQVTTLAILLQKTSQDLKLEAEELEKELKGKDFIELATLQKIEAKIDAKLSFLGTKPSGWKDQMVAVKETAVGLEKLKGKKNSLFDQIKTKHQLLCIALLKNYLHTPNKQQIKDALKASTSSSLSELCTKTEFTLYPTLPIEAAEPTRKKRKIADNMEE